MMSVLHTSLDVVVFVTATFVCGASLAPRGIGDPLLRLIAGLTASIAAQFALGFIAFAAGLSNRATAAALAVGVVVLVVIRREHARPIWRDPDVRRALALWALLATWSLGLLALVVTYSGGGWASDWLEHWHRTLFFALRQPADTQFGGLYSLAARPPLVNLLLALWLEGSSPAFADFQVLMTLLGTLAVLPMIYLASQWRPHRATAVWVVIVLILNPAFAENVTFSWTKLATAAFVLAGIALMVAGLKRPDARPERLAAATCLGIAAVAHYSAVPWVIAVAVGYLVAMWQHRTRALSWREVGAMAVRVSALPAVWVVWALSQYGTHGTFGSNTTAEAWTRESPLQRLTVAVSNLVDTVIPFLLRGEPNDGLILQSSRLGRLRDVAFNVYQVNLPLAFGCAGLLVLLLSLARRERNEPAAGSLTTTFYWVSLPLAGAIGMAVSTMRDEWGLAHICLQPLVLLGLARIAAELPRLPALTLAAWSMLAAVDFGLGIVLHFGLESWMLAPFVAPGNDGRVFLGHLNVAARSNALEKWSFNLRFFADEFPLSPPVTSMLLAVLLAGLIVWICRSRRSGRGGQGLSQPPS